MDVSTAFKINAHKIEPLTQPLNDFRGGQKTQGTDADNMFSAVFNSALENISSTNKYLSDAENEQIKLALGQSDNTHDLAIALQKASTMLQYTVAVRDKFLEAYKELMNMQF